MFFCRHVCIYVLHVYVYVCDCICTCRCVYVYVYMIVYVHVYLYMYGCMCIFYMYVHVYMYIYMFICICLCLCLNDLNVPSVILNSKSIYHLDKIRQQVHLRFPTFSTWCAPWWLARMEWSPKNSEASGVSWVSHVPNANQQKKWDHLRSKGYFFQDQQLRIWNEHLLRGPRSIRLCYLKKKNIHIPNKLPKWSTGWDVRLPILEWGNNRIQVIIMFPIERPTVESACPIFRVHTQMYHIPCTVYTYIYIYMYIYIFTYMIIYVYIRYLVVSNIFPWYMTDIFTLAPRAALPVPSPWFVPRSWCSTARKNDAFATAGNWSHRHGMDGPFTDDLLRWLT